MRDYLGGILNLVTTSEKKHTDLLLAPNCGDMVAALSTVEHIWKTSGAHQGPGAPETAMGTCYF